MSSIFSKIIAGEIPGYKVYEDDYVCAILDINPIQKGHVLVIPKQEVDQLFDLEEKLFDHVMHRVRYLAQILKAQTNCARVCVIVEGYAIPHAHVHLIPTNKPEDCDKSLAHPAQKEELEEMQKLLQS
jgi:histidine triad (HIT) family protein